MQHGHASPKQKVYKGSNQVLLHSLDSTMAGTTPADYTTKHINGDLSQNYIHIQRERFKI